MKNKWWLLYYIFTYGAVLWDEWLEMSRNTILIESNSVAPNHSSSEARKGKHSILQRLVIWMHKDHLFGSHHIFLRETEDSFTVICYRVKRSSCIQQSLKYMHILVQKKYFFYVGQKVEGS